MEWRKQLQQLTVEQRVGELEVDADSFESNLQDIARAIKVQTGSIIAGMGVIVLFLAGIVFKA
jgi:hypothetical protein